MKHVSGITSVTAEVENNTLIIRSSNPLKILSSAVLNGGFKQTISIVNVGVPENCGNDKHDEHWNAEDFLKKQVARLSLPKETVGLMTAAKMQNLATSTQKSGKINLTVFITAGTSIAVTAGESVGPKEGRSEPKKCGTINIIATVDGNLTESCMVDAIKTITEAKTVVLKELDVRSRFSGELASGTMTDSVAVACTGHGELIKYAGTFTVLGELLAKSVREATKEAVLRQDHLRPDRPLTIRLEERGITLAEILKLAPDFETAGSDSETVSELKTRVKKLLTDQRIVSLILAALRLDEDENSHLIPIDQFGSSIDNGVILEILRNLLQNGARRREDENKTLTSRTKHGNMGFLTHAVLSSVMAEGLPRIS